MILTRQIYKRVNFPKYLGKELVSCQRIVHLRNFLDVKKGIWFQYFLTFHESANPTRECCHHYKTCHIIHWYLSASDPYNLTYHLRGPCQGQGDRKLDALQGRLDPYPRTQPLHHSYHAWASAIACTHHSAALSQQLFPSPWWQSPHLLPTKSDSISYNTKQHPISHLHNFQKFFINSWRSQK